MSLKSTLNNFFRSEAALDPRLVNPEISEDIQQTLTRLLGWDAATELFRLLRVDTLGRLIVATDVGTFSSFNDIDVTVTNASTQILNANPARRSFLIKNTGPSTIFITRGGVSTVAKYPLAAGEIFSLDDYVGDLTGITAAGNGVVKGIEV